MKQFQRDVSSKVAEFVEVQTRAYAIQAGGRKRKIKPAHSRKTYRYANTGQLGRNIKKLKKGDRYFVDAGTRADYSKNGYHGMYFLVEKRGEREVEKVLRDTKKYTQNLKL